MELREIVKVALLVVAISAARGPLGPPLTTLFSGMDKHLGEWAGVVRSCLASLLLSWGFFGLSDALRGKKDAMWYVAIALVVAQWAMDHLQGASGFEKFGLVDSARKSKGPANQWEWLQTMRGGVDGHPWCSVDPATGQQSCYYGSTSLYSTDTASVQQPGFTSKGGQSRGVRA